MRDQGSRAFRRAITTASALCLLVASATLLLAPLGAYTHLREMLTTLCVTAAHITSDIASLSVVMLAGSAITVTTISALASVLLHRRTADAWTPVSGVARRRVASACRATGIDVRTVVFSHDEAIACSRGVAAPSIWISDSAVAQLTDDELVAVLAHEHHHCVRRDPAKRQLLEVLSRALFAFPVVREATNAFRRCAEFAADDAAVRATSARTTAAALLRFASAPSQTAVLVQFGSNTTVGERVQRLIGESTRPAARDRRAVTITTSIVAAIAACVGVVALLPANM